MPTTINGIGTGYYGKKNIEKFDGICEKCRRGVQLRNYETRLWFCVLYLPVIPLGKKQILNYCPSCTQHMAIEFAEWERIRQNEIDQSAAEMGQNKESPAAAIKMHSTLVSFHKQDEAQRLAEIMLGKFGEDANVQFYLGGWHERCGRGPLADECFARALQLEPANPTFKRAVAIGQIEQGNLPRARQLLADLEPPSPNFDPATEEPRHAAWNPRYAETGSPSRRATRPEPLRPYPHRGAIGRLLRMRARESSP